MYIVVKKRVDIQRIGLNLIFKKTISLKEALTGFTFELKHLNGKRYNINNTSIVVLTLSEYDKEYGNG